MSWVGDHFPNLETFSEALGVAAAIAALTGFEPLALALTTAKTAIDLGQALAGEGDWAKVRDDAIGFALFGAGRVLTGYARAKTGIEARCEDESVGGGAALRAGRRRMINELERAAETAVAQGAVLGYVLLSAAEGKVATASLFVALIDAAGEFGEVPNPALAAEGLATRLDGEVRELPSGPPSESGVGSQLRSWTANPRPTSSSCTGMHCTRRVNGWRC